MAKKVEAWQKGIVKSLKTFIKTAIGMVIAWGFIIGSVILVETTNAIKNKKLSF